VQCREPAGGNRRRARIFLAAALLPVPLLGACAVVAVGNAIVEVGAAAVGVAATTVRAGASAVGAAVDALTPDSGEKKKP